MTPLPRPCQVRSQDMTPLPRRVTPAPVTPSTRPATAACVSALVISRKNAAKMNESALPPSGVNADFLVQELRRDIRAIWPADRAVLGE